ncbi:MAG: O-antigen ligase domain-containing protein [Dehalococcoidia bacterium]|nr:O-antigen ligase domain-containing protein [Dehalococcoidia bacterium]
MSERVATAAQSLPPIIGYLGLGLVISAAVVVSPILGLLVAALAMGIILLTFDQHLPGLFLNILGALLLAYLFLGKGAAYLGMEPVYIGELVLGLAALSLLTSFSFKKLLPIHWLLIAFMALGAARTLPYVGRDGIDALRDAVLWGYGVFALAVSFALTPAAVRRIVRWYSAILPFFLIWVPIAGIGVALFPEAVPNSPSGQPLIWFKGGDSAAHLAGVAAFLILALPAWPRLRSGLSDAFLWTLWFAGIVVAGTLNRGGLLAASVSTLTALSFRPSRNLIPLAFIATVLISIAAVTNLSVDTGGHRDVSVDQLRRNALSIFGDDDPSLRGTEEFRLRWWDKIIGYTWEGQHFWTGKGFGVNLATDDGFGNLLEDDSLRSPHNSHLTVLARMGVPGLALWIVLQAAFGYSMLAAYFRAKKNGFPLWAAINVWILVYWLAFLINTAFDVFLEGPQGGIWFWSVFGLGLGSLSLQRRLNQPLEAPEVTRSS